MNTESPNLTYEAERLTMEKAIQCLRQWIVLVS